MGRFRELPVASTKGLYPGTGFGHVWDSVGPPLMPSDILAKLESYVDVFVAELASRLPEGASLERDGTANEYRVFVTSPKMQGKRSGLAINFDRLGPGLVIYLRRFVPASKRALLFPWLGRATPTHITISDTLQQATVTALERTFPAATPFTWRNESR